MKKICLLSGLLILWISVSAQNTVYSRVKVFASHYQIMEMAGAGIDVTEGELKPGEYLISDYSQDEIARLESLGLKMEVLIEDVAQYYADRNLEKSTNISDYKGTSDWTIPENFSFGSMGGHATFDEAVAHLDEMFAQFPDLITQKVSIGQSVEGRDLWMVKISDNPNSADPEPQVLYTALHHAREPAGLMTLLYYMWYLLENYETDPIIHTLVNNTEMYFIPVLNPDGYVYNQTTNPNGGGMWRKNRRVNSGTSCKGVDLNRNYAYMWGIDNTGSSPDPCEETYRGTQPFSEPEMQAVRDFCESHNFANALNYHTYSNLLLYAWGYTEEPCPDDDLFFAHATRYTRDSHYTFGAGSTTIYPTNGGSDDWMYGEQVTKPKILAYTPELGGGGDGFWCPVDRIIPIAQENMIQNLLLAAFAGKYAEARETSPTIINSTTGVLSFDFSRLGLGENGNYTISLTPLSNEIVAVGDPVQISEPELLTIYPFSIPYALNPAVVSGTTIQLLASVDNGDYIISDTITKIFGETVVLFEDNCNTLSNWISPNWSVTNSAYHSAPGSITDSPSGNYPNSHLSTVTLNTTLDLTEAAFAMVTFWARWEIEEGYDYVQFQVSTNNGINWQPLEGLYTVAGNSNQAPGEPLYDGFQPNWIQEEIDLTAYLGNQIKFRFFLKTDNYVTEDGFYFDDLSLQVIENAVTGIPLHTDAGMEYLSDPVPNPASGETMISIKVPDYLPACRFRIYSSTGGLFRELPVSQDQEKLFLQVDGWQPGVYYYMLVGETFRSKMKKIVVY